MAKQCKKKVSVSLKEGYQISENNKIPERFNSSSVSINNLSMSHSFNSSSLKDVVSSTKIVRYIS